VDARLSLADDLLTNGDKMSMAASVEARVPFLDLDYMAFVESLPPGARIRGLTRTYLHKRAVARWLPDTIVSRTKRGFDTPIDQWFRTEVSGSVRRLIAAADAACGRYFDTTAIGVLIDDHISGRQDHRRQIFSLLMFELWHRTFIERQPFAFEIPK
jgi:asparagine synthase (glutamine-hydrolysing)